MSRSDSFSPRMRLTRDMAETLLEHFERFARDGAVTLEMNEAGVWFVDPETDRVMFLGQADLSEWQRARLIARCH